MGAAQSQQAIAESRTTRKGRLLRFREEKIKANVAESLVDRVHKELTLLALLHVEHCRLKAFPTNLGVQLASLTRVSFAFNLLTELPSDMSSLAHLLDLDLSNNQLTKWPDASLASLPSLIALDLSYNAIGNLLVDDKSQLRSRLQSLSLAGNKMTSFPLHVCYLHGLVALDLSENGILLMAEQVSGLTCIQRIRIRSNQLHEIPTELCLCTTLRTLDFAHNALKGVPEELPLLSELRELDLSHNLLANVSPAVCRLAQLSSLKLGANKLKALPPAIGELENLSSLSLCENLLTELPVAVFNIQALRRLDCAFNQLTSLPKAEALPPLIELILHHNQFKAVPKQLLMLKSLLIVSLDWNPFDTDSIAEFIREEGTMAIVHRQRVADARARAQVRRTSVELAAREVLSSALPVASIDRDAVSQQTQMVLGGRKVSKFQLLFEATAKRCDFSSSVSTWLKQLDASGRWRFVMQYDLAAMQLLTAVSPPKSEAILKRDSSSSNDLLVAPLSPELAEVFAYELTLKTMPADATASLLTQLKRAFESSPDGFVLRFIVANGIGSLVEYFNNTIHDQLLTVENLGLKNLFFDIAAVLSVCAAVFERAPHSFLLTHGAVNIVAMCMTDAVSAEAFVLMEKISRYSTAAVYDALRHYQRCFGTNFRFGLLVAAFDVDQSDMALREASFRIVNRLVSEVDDIEERFDLRNEIMRAGMSEVMGAATSASSSLAQLVAEFEALADADFGAMIEQFGQEAVMERLETFMAEADDLGDDLLRCAVMCSGELRGTCTVPYTATTTGREVRDILLQKFPIVDPAPPALASGANQSSGSLVLPSASPAIGSEPSGSPSLGASSASTSSSSTNLRASRAKGLGSSTKKKLDKEKESLIAPQYDVLNEKIYGLYVHAKQKQKTGFWLDLSKPMSEYETIEGEIKAEFRMKPWQLYILHGDDDKAHSYSFSPQRSYAEVVVELFEKLDIPSGETPLDYGLYITEATYSRSKKSDTESLSRSRAGSISDACNDALTRSWIDDAQRLLDLPQLSRQRTILLLAKRPQPLRVTLLDANEPTTFFFDETDTILLLRTRFLARVLASMAADVLATASRDVDDYGLFVELSASASVSGGSGSVPNTARGRGSSQNGGVGGGMASTSSRDDNDDSDDDSDSGHHSTLPKGDVTLSAGGGGRVVATELLANATLAECRQKVNASTAPLRFGRRPRSIRVHVASEGIAETMQLDVGQTHGKLLSALCAKFELPTTNEYVLATMVGADYVTLDSRKTLQQSGATALWLRVDSEATGTAGADVNIWDEPPGSEYITYDDKEKKKVLAATFNKLVELLTSTEEYDRDFLEVFLMTYKAFATAEQLLKKLTERWNAPARIDAEQVRRVRLRIGVFLRNYIASESRLGFKRSVKEKLERFVRDIVMAGGAEFVSLGDGLLKTLNDTPLGRKRAVPSLTQPAPKPTAIETHISSAQMNFNELSEVEIAEQMSWYLFQIYEQIEHTELFNGNWAKKGSERTSKHVLRMIDYFNYTSTWVATLLVGEKKYKARVKLLEKFVRIAGELRKLNNFHLAMAFLVAFNNSAISRLKWTFAKLPKKVVTILREIETTMSMEASFKLYRGALDQVDTPCIPYVGVALTDLTFVEEGNPNKLDNKIYFVKQKFVHNIVNTLLRFQHLAYSGIQPVDSLVHFINGQPKMDDKQLYAQSLLLEPRGAPQPKF